MMRYASVMAPPLSVGGPSRHRAGAGLSSSPHTPPSASALPLPAPPSSPTQSTFRKPYSSYPSPSSPKTTTHANTSNTSSLPTRPVASSSQRVGVVGAANPPQRPSPLADLSRTISTAAATHISTFHHYNAGDDDDDESDDDESDDDDSNCRFAFDKTRLFKPRHVNVPHIYDRCCCVRSGAAGYNIVDGQFCRRCNFLRRSKRRVPFVRPHAEQRGEKSRPQTILPEPALLTLVRPLIGDTSSDDGYDGNDDLDDHSEWDDFSDYDEDDVDNDIDDVTDAHDDNDDSGGGDGDELEEFGSMDLRSKSAPIAIPRAGWSLGDQMMGSIEPSEQQDGAIHSYVAGQNPSLGFLPPSVRRRAAIAGNDVRNSTSAVGHSSTTVPSMWDVDAVVPGRPDTTYRSAAHNDDFDERFFY